MFLHAQAWIWLQIKFKIMSNCGLSLETETLTDWFITFKLELYRLWVKRTMSRQLEHLCIREKPMKTLVLHIVVDERA